MTNRRNWNLTLKLSTIGGKRARTDKFLIVRRSIQFAPIGVQEIALYLFTSNAMRQYLAIEPVGEGPLDEINQRGAEWCLYKSYTLALEWH